MKNNEPSISVVIPAYNEEKYLPKTLASIAKLDRKPDEVIVVDGGSIDKTADIARSYGARVVTIEHRGIGFARQKGLEAARGKIVTYTDADTLVPRDWLTKIENTLLQKGIVGVYGYYTVPDGRLVYRFFINYINPLLFSLGYRLDMPFACGQNIAFWKNKGIAAGGFPVDFQSVEDFEMIKRLKSIGRVIYRDDNNVISSGRRGNEGTISFLIREITGMTRYFLTGKADTFTFPDIR